MIWKDGSVWVVECPLCADQSSRLHKDDAEALEASWEDRILAEAERIKARRAKEDGR